MLSPRRIRLSDAQKYYSLKTTRYIQYTALKVMLGVYPPISEYAQTRSPATCFSISPISTPILFHPPSQRHFPSTLNLGQHVPDPHCNHLILKLSIHLRQCHPSLQEEDQERSPFPSAVRQ